MTFVTCKWTQIFDTSEPRTLRSRVCCFGRQVAALDRFKIPRRSLRANQQNIQILDVFV